MSLNITDFFPLLGGIAGGVILLWLANRLLIHNHKEIGSEGIVPRQLIMLGLTLVVLVVIILLLPVGEATRGQVLSLLGVLLTAVIALSSTTFVANAMAGLMLRMTHSFVPGDFVRVGDQFGRVTERGLLHTEIQTEDRDLSTLPNLHLVTNPVTVVHSSGTIISAGLTLGYDESHQRIDSLLREAAEQAGLQDPFVLVTELNDFSVSYRVAGFLPEVKQLLTAKSNLRKAVLDVLHAHDVEIVSPSFMNQRQLGVKDRMIPRQVAASPAASAGGDQSPEDIIFDKAEEAANLEQLKQERTKLEEELKQLSVAGRSGSEEDLSTRSGQKREVEQRLEWINRQLNVAKQEA